MKWSTVGLLGAAGLMTASASDAAETVHLYLKASGIGDIRGESTQVSLGRDGSIECVQFDMGVRAERRWETVRCVKRIDKASPLLMKALVTGATVDGTFKFFRPNPKGDGTTEQFFTVVIKGGRVDGLRVQVSNPLSSQAASLPPMEEVTFTFKTINWTYTNGGITWEDTPAAQPAGATPMPTTPTTK
jgi:type VI secretion system secreted protein Hcp